MTFQDIFDSELLHLPYSQTKESFNASLKDLLQKYLKLVESLDDTSIDIPGLDHINGVFVKEAQRKFVPGLLDIIEIYHSGRPAEAFKRLKKVMSEDIKNYSEILSFSTYPDNHSFFRMRVKKGNFALPRKEMFHIPFELRGMVAIQRYSIPGFPCLYLGSTLYGCWEELRKTRYT